MMYRCCLIALMIAHCVSSADPVARRARQLRTGPGGVDEQDLRNGSHTEGPGPIGSAGSRALELGDFVTDERRGVISESAIQPLIEQDIYDDDDDESGSPDDDEDDGRAVTVEDLGAGGAGGGPGNVIIRDVLRVGVALPGKLTSPPAPADSLEALVEKSIATTSRSKPHASSQHHRPELGQPQTRRTADESFQSSSSSLELTANPASDGIFLSTTDLGGLTTAGEGVPAGIANVNLSLATQRTIRRPSNGAQAVALIQNLADVSTPPLAELDLQAYNESPELTPNRAQGHQQPASEASSSSSSSSDSDTNPSGSVLNLGAAGGSATTATVMAGAGPQRQRTINSMNLNPTTPAMVVKPVGEHRKLLKSTGPILNYVFDHHPPYYKSNYYNARYGPHFETDNVTNITVQNGDTLFLSCRISLLQDKTVSWVRRKSGDTALQLLTVGRQTYSGDSRYQIEFQYPNNWRLKISQANKNDEGVYECQISTHPPKVIIYYLHVNAPEVLIVDEEAEPLYDKYYEVGSTIKLMCKIRHISMLRSVVYWIHNENILNHDTTRGGISVKTNLTSVGANSTLFVAKVNRQDSGSYTCSIGPNQHYSISVHVLNGTANPYGIYQRSCAFSTILQAVDLWFVVRSLVLILVKLSWSR
ncbi:uncharacterized protein LOC128267652 [Anopheles cruzii]|uniref:uncharacterized protein LOC128267652 n=1 Tax=Anopheles cruzii TaxID=68878 RepID=UPI0022EC68AA|nr:uncharacterized protein LOC128267652 [Anopheles cruzii]